MPLVRVADVKHTPSVPLHCHRITRSTEEVAVPDVPAVQTCNPPNVSLGLRVAWDAATARYRAAAGVISCEAQSHISVIALQQLLQMAYPGIDVFLRIERVLQVQLAGGLRHELHQSHGTLAGNRIGIEVRLNLYQRAHQIRIDVVAGRCLVYRGINLPLCKPTDCRRVLGTWRLS